MSFLSGILLNLSGETPPGQNYFSSYPAEIIFMFFFGALLSYGISPVAEYFIKKEPQKRFTGLIRKQKAVTVLCGGLAFSVLVDWFYVYDCLRASARVMEAALYLVFAFALVLVFLLISCVDSVCGTIPDTFQVLLLIIAVGSAFTPLGNHPSLPGKIVGAVIISVPLLAVALITGGMGGGDIKLFAVCGFMLGWQDTLLAFLIAVVFAAVFGVISAKLRGADLKTAKIAFAPFICFGAYLSLRCGGFILDALFP